MCIEEPWKHTRDYDFSSTKLFIMISIILWLGKADSVLDWLFFVDVHSMHSYSEFISCKYMIFFLAGVKPWNHQGSNFLSIIMLLTNSSAILYDFGFCLSKMWSHSEQILHLLTKLCLFALLSSYLVVAWCSKLHKYVWYDVPFLSWATTWNIGYVIWLNDFRFWTYQGKVNCDEKL